MPIKKTVAILGLLAALSFALRQPVKATGANARDLDTTSPFLNLSKIKYRVVTTATVESSASSNKSLDTFRFVVDGIQLQDRDQLSFSLTGPDGTVDIGSPTFDGDNAFIELRRRRNPQGAAGTNGFQKLPFPIGADPYTFSRPSMIFNPNKQRMTFFSGRGIAQAAPLAAQVPGLTNGVDHTLTVHVRRPGVDDFDFVFNTQMDVRLQIDRRSGLRLLRGQR